MSAARYDSPADHYPASITTAVGMTRVECACGWESYRWPTEAEAFAHQRRHFAAVTGLDLDKRTAYR